MMGFDAMLGSKSTFFYMSFLILSDLFPSLHFYHVPDSSIHPRDLQTGLRGIKSNSIHPVEMLTSPRHKEIMR